MKYELEIYGKIFQLATESAVALNLIKSEVNEFLAEDNLSFQFSDLDYVNCYIVDLILPFFGNQQDWMENLHPTIHEMLEQKDSMGEDFSDRQFKQVWSMDAIVKILTKLCEDDSVWCKKLKEKGVLLYLKQLKNRDELLSEFICNGFWGLNNFGKEELAEWYYNNHLLDSDWSNFTSEKEIESTLKNILLP